MAPSNRLLAALTIAGSDSGGGAGIQADLKTFAALGVHGATVITCVTAQNAERILGIEAVSAKMVRRQLAAVFSGLKIGAIKVGMLYSEEIIRAVAEFYDAEGAGISLVVDPVMVSTCGVALLRRGAIKYLERELFPRASLVTPNIPEAELLVGGRICSEQDMGEAARKIQGRYGCAVLVKGGHLPGAGAAVDYYFDGLVERRLRGRRINKIRTHGTGCTYSAAIAGYLCRGLSLEKAVIAAKKYMIKALAGGVDVAGRRWLGNFPGKCDREEF